MDGPAHLTRYIPHYCGYYRNSRRKINTMLSQGLQVPDWALHLELTQQHNRYNKGSYKGLCNAHHFASPREEQMRSRFSYIFTAWHGCAIRPVPRYS